MSTKQSNLSSIRREYGALALDPDQMQACPIEQARIWLEHALKTEANDPTAMCLSTVDTQNRPDARVVLLKAIQDDGFVFYSHYQSKKGLELASNPNAALTFYWPVLARQLRVRGVTALLSAAESDRYFATRPYLSRLSACVSLQSRPILNRSSLEAEIEALKHTYHDNKDVPRPNAWGGYLLKPIEMEFWQGRDNRLHDRIHYFYEPPTWKKQRLAP